MSRLGRSRPPYFSYVQTATHCLASGLDDYPRAKRVTDDEGHVDLHVWMVVVCDTMADLTATLLRENGGEDDGFVKPNATSVFVRLIRLYLIT